MVNWLYIIIYHDSSLPFCIFEFWSGPVRIIFGRAFPSRISQNATTWRGSEYSRWASFIAARHGKHLCHRGYFHSEISSPTPFFTHVITIRIHILNVVTRTDVGKSWNITCTTIITLTRSALNRLTYTHTHTHLLKHAYTHIRTRTLTHIHILTCTQIHTRTYTYKCT